jgi:thioredoxin reductase (NADPH)
MHANVLILGSGPAGLTAALYAARANLEPVVIRGRQPGGLIATTDAVENYPGFPDAVSGLDLADKMETQAARFGTTFLDGIVEHVTLQDRPFNVTVDNGDTHTADTIIIATGASPRKLGVPGEDALANRGVSYCAVCDGVFFRNKRIVVVGGGNSAVEEGLFLTRFASEVVVIHRRATLCADPILQQRAFTNPKLRFVWDSVVTEVVGNGKVQGVRITHVKTGDEEVFRTDAVFPYIGHLPNTALFTGQLTMDASGHIVTDSRTCTNIPGVFACGDVVDHIYRQAITAAASGCMAAMEASWYLDAGTTDGGATWHIGESLDVAPVTMSFTDANQGWVAGGHMSDTRLYHTTDGGATWHAQAIDLEDDFVLNDLFFVDTHTGWAVGVTGRGGSDTSLILTTAGSGGQ